MRLSTADFLSFKELDARWAVPKGTAFRAFKRALPALQETADFIRLDAVRDQDEIQRLRAAGRIYASSVHVVLLSKTAVPKLTRP
ncbi:MAG: hypothetical protein KGL00_03130 [Gammaproteobacteria bacterium]|nr:hypothetical protein [Gammaproteobacteria bacterium]MDE1888388.1 hypothetical protein [Gammaproteobacteria bacterium]MDE2022991.1 hypothetical protein [Gammaproteobacteria bacterium]MDE2140391.1 hypothetical protein [Gammaproteobacteria bacterium]MDE2273166.1 hypothetical protein [Gammaproteobacteria bacterium]